MQQGEMKMSGMNDFEKGCPYGKDVAKSNTTLENRVKALETKFATVLAATASDDGKTLQIDSNGKVALVTV